MPLHGHRATGFRPVLRGETAAEDADFRKVTFRRRPNLLGDHLLRGYKHLLRATAAFAPRLDRRNFAHVTPRT
ncbi:hypothetical protein CUJ84_Chr002584 [Rhizobium leguminosarum]|uniref:Uncharacterized protein n=1 Tax=Rhizobium leguminosarum TaxID=384 RepID=A0A2K9Z3W2_RHILE|nr:hypothetical protein CUJ84_Chr002584 [Rhizobium leguminosarum]